MLIFLLLCESINFCYWLEPNWKIEYENNIYKGSIAMFLSMKKYFESNPEFFETKNLINLENIKNSSLLLFDVLIYICKN